MNANNRTYFTFYESFFTAINKLEISEQLPIYKAIAEYALYRREPDLVGMGAVMWELIRPNLESNWVRWENGRKGGAPNGNANAVKQPKNNQKTTEKQPNPSEEIGDKEIGDKNKEIGENIMRTAKRFTPPSLDEVSEYITQKGYNINAELFMNFYTSNGWKIGRNSMKDWKATVRSWNTREMKNQIVNIIKETRRYVEL